MSQTCFHPAIAEAGLGRPWPSWTQSGVVTTALVLMASCMAAPVDGGAAPQRRDAASLAEWVLNTPEIRRGLCLCLGFRDVTRMTALARKGRYLVHGISPGRSAVREARKEIQEQGLYGVVSVSECSFERLPYADNLANLVIVDDFARAQKEGLTFGEMWRVLAPLGAALVRTGGTPASERALQSLGNAAATSLLVCS